MKILLLKYYIVRGLGVSGLLAGPLSEPLGKLGWKEELSKIGGKQKFYKIRDSLSPTTTLLYGIIRTKRKQRNKNVNKGRV